MASDLRHVCKVVYCRGVQYVLKACNYILPYRTPQCLEGPGTSRELGTLLRKTGIDHVLVVTGSAMARRGLLAHMLEGMDAEGIRYFVQCFDRPDPTSDDVELGYRSYRDHGCQAIVALGGGSRMDCAKAIAAKAAHPRTPISRLQGLLRVHSRVPALIAVPTTAGSGSETTIAAVITDSATHRKAAINDPVLIPRYAVLDPLLTVNLPPQITAETGMDALCHAVEAYTNRTYCTKVELNLAKQAVQLVYKNLLAAYADGGNLEARQNMQRAAFWAGRAFTRGCVGYVHAIGHTLGGLYGIPHGRAMAALLPKVLRQYGPAVYRPLAELSEACGLGGATEKEKAEGFLRWIDAANRTMGIPETFPCIRQEDVEQMAAWADREANPVYPVPVIWGREDFYRLIASIRE